MRVSGCGSEFECCTAKSTRQSTYKAVDSVQKWDGTLNTEQELQQLDILDA